MVQAKPYSFASSPEGFLPSLPNHPPGTSGNKSWDYVQVRPGAHMFWWLRRSPYRDADPTKPWPIILWLQGGPGGSGVGFGNFMEIGPLDGNLKPRDQTWLQKADLLFVDNPVGTGYSYVEDQSLLVKTDYEAAADLTKFLIEVSAKIEDLGKRPFHIFGESYGGKFAVTLAVTALEAIQDGKLNLQLAGVALGGSWISPEDHVFSWGPLLKDVSRIDNNGVEKSLSLAMKIKQQLEDGNSEDATQKFGELQQVINDSSNKVDFYNFMLDAHEHSGSGEKFSCGSFNGLFKSNYHIPSANAGDRGTDLGSLMNGKIKEMLQIIPDHVSWGGREYSVFLAMWGDFMKPRIEEVDELLDRGINVTIYNGQLDLICSTKGTESWVGKLKWAGLKHFLGMDRTPLYCGSDDNATKGFVASYQNLRFYWILGAGHMVPIDQPSVSLTMVGEITQAQSINLPMSLLNLNVEGPIDQPSVSLDRVGTDTQAQSVNHPLSLLDSDVEE